MTSGMKKPILMRVLLGAVVVAAVLAGLWVWQQRQASALPDGIVAGNGRLEAVQVDVATKFGGRVAEVLVKEGDRVEAGQLVARMDTQALNAHLREAEAQVANAKSAQATAATVVSQRLSAQATAANAVSQRLSAKATSDALVVQRQGDIALAQQQFDRSKALLAEGAATRQQFDVDRNRLDSANAALSAATSQVEEARMAIDVARSQVEEARKAVDVARSQAAGAGAPVQVAMAETDRIRTDLAESELKAPRAGRVQHRLIEPGEVVGAGAKVLTLLDLADVYMTVFLPAEAAGKLAVGGEARLVLDAAPDYVLPAKVSYVASDAQFTPKAVETSDERQKLVFEVRLQLDAAFLASGAPLVKAGLPGVGYVRVDAAREWPANLSVKLPPGPAGR